ncbi:MAG: PDZ domain-containing protein [Myxococcota bacterium]
MSPLDPGRLRLALLVLLTALTACALPRRAHAKPPTPITYRLEIPDPHRQYVHVTMELSPARGKHSTLAMPAWTPGSYLVRDHARHVYDVRATDRKGAALRVEHTDKQSWTVHHGGRPFTVRYRVFANEASVRTSHVDDRHASLMGTSIFLYVVGELSRGAHVDITLPPKWSAHTALAPAEHSADGHAVFSAPDYDTLVDSPIELGTPTIATFTVDDTHFEYVLTGAEGTKIDLDRLSKEAEQIARAQSALMAGLPMPRYLFLMRVSPVGGGGLEHATSTSMMMSRASFDTSAGYKRATRLAAHEMFHLWNVKRIHDRVLGPFDYSRENHTKLLWFHEGFTETMEGLSLVRAGIVEPSEHVASLGKRWTTYLGKAGRNHDPIEDISFDAWTKAYQPSANHPNVSISYYEKGDFIGIVLDIELRLRSAKNGRSGSVPGLFRRLMASHGASNTGITHADIVAAATAEAGEPMDWFFERYVQGTEEIPLETLLPQIGVKVEQSAVWLDDDGKLLPELTPAQRLARIHIGLKLDSGATVRNVEPGSPADGAGLMRDDQIIAVAGRRTDDRRTVNVRLGEHDPGQQVELSLFRAGRLLHRTVTLAENPRRTYRFSLLPTEELSPVVAKLRDEWLAVLP